MKTAEKICINCPAGCHLHIAVEEDGTVRTTGNRCPGGERYAVQEMTDPRRVVTAVVRSGGEHPVCVPVKSSVPVPKAMIPGLLQTLFAMKVELPVQIGTVILKDYRGTGIDILATREFPR